MTTMVVHVAASRLGAQLVHSLVHSLVGSQLCWSAPLCLPTNQALHSLVLRECGVASKMSKTHLCEDASGARVAAKRGSVPLLGWSASLCLPTNQALRGMQQHLIAYSQALGRSERRRCLALRTNTLGAPRLGAFSFASLPTNQALAASRAGVRCE